MTRKEFILKSITATGLILAPSVALAEDKGSSVPPLSDGFNLCCGDGGPVVSTEAYTNGKEFVVHHGNNIYLIPADQVRITEKGEGIASLEIIPGSKFIKMNV